MKKLNLLGAIMITIGSYSAQTNTAVPINTYSTSNIANDPQTPNAITNRFNTDYPNTSPVWNRDGNNYRADYTMGTMKRSITYDVNGRVVSREEELLSGAYPTSIIEYCTDKFPKEPYTVWLNTDSEGNKTYYAKCSEETHWFDNKGKYRKKKITSPRDSSPKAKARGVQ